MNRSMVVLAVALCSLTACMEEMPQEPIVEEAPAAVEAVPEIAAGAAAVVLAVPTACQTSREQLEDVVAELQRQPKSADLKSSQAALSAIVSDVCN